MATTMPLFELINPPIHMGGQLTSPEQVAQFCFAGKARFTLVSRATGARFTYRCNVKKDKSVTFVSLLRGPDNGNDFAYMGIVKDGTFRGTSKSRMGTDTPSFKAFSWFYEKLTKEHKVPDVLEVWHEGRCGRCGRALTVPSSIASGFGPECAGRI